MTKTIKIGYMDFGRDFNPENHFFTKLLRTKYEVVISDKPDYIFYTLGSQTHHAFDGIRIFWTGENVIPNFNHCDYALGFQHLTFGDRYHRLPLWRSQPTLVEKGIQRAIRLSDSEALNRDFCATVISNSKQTDGMRESAFEKLSCYKQVASGGKWRNNVGGRVADKAEFQSRYKFTLAFENTYAPGYTTEKIMDAFASGCIPMYYGDPLVIQDFNPDSFINAHDFNSLDELVSYVKKVDSDDALYLKMLRAPIFRNNEMPADLTNEHILSFFEPIFDVPYEQARRRFYAKTYSDIDIYHIKNRDVKEILKAFIKQKIKKIFNKKGK